MEKDINEQTRRLMDRLMLTEEPMGTFYTDQQPKAGFYPEPLPPPTREAEKKDQIDWPNIFGGFSCAMGHIWRARRKKTAAWFSKERFGCPGAAFWLGFLKPQSETIIHYVSSGIPGRMEGEHYCASAESLRNIFLQIDPRPAPAPYCVVKPLSLFGPHETPELVTFFTRPEPLCGLHQLSAYVTDDPEAVRSPWGAGCGNMVVWPLKYLEKGEKKAVLGGWDPSARKFFKADELSFTVGFEMFKEMLVRWESSFLSTQTWETTMKKAARSQKRWGEGC